MRRSAGADGELQNKVITVGVNVCALFGHIVGAGADEYEAKTTIGWAHGCERAPARSPTDIALRYVRAGGARTRERK